MIARYSIVVTAALALGCGSAQQLAQRPGQEALTDGASPRQPTKHDSWCRPPEGFPLEIMLIQGDLCWMEIDATQERCAEIIREQSWPYMSYGGRCWYLQARKPKRQPTSSAAEPLAPVTTR